MKWKKYTPSKGRPNYERVLCAGLRLSVHHRVSPHGWYAFVFGQQTAKIHASPYQAMTDADAIAQIRLKGVLEDYRVETRQEKSDSARLEAA